MEFPHGPVLFFFFFLFAPHPHDPATCMLVVIPSALITSQQDGAMVSNGVKAKRGRREPRQCVESALKVWNLQTNQIFTLSI